MLYPCSETTYKTYTFPLATAVVITGNKRSVTVKNVVICDSPNNQTPPQVNLTETILNLCMACFLNNEEQLAPLIEKSKQENNALDVLQSRKPFYISTDNQPGYHTYTLIKFVCLRGTPYAVAAIAKETIQLSLLNILHDREVTLQPETRKMIVEAAFNMSLRSQEDLDNYIQRTINDFDQVSHLLSTFIATILPPELKVRDINNIIADYAKDSLLIEAFSEPFFWERNNTSVPKEYRQGVQEKVKEKIDLKLENLHKMNEAINAISDTNSDEYIIAIGNFYYHTFKFIRHLSERLKQAHYKYLGILHAKNLLTEANCNKITREVIKSKQLEQIKRKEDAD